MANRTVSTTATTASVARLKTTTRPMTRRTSATLRVFVSAWAISRARSPRRRDISSANRVARVMMPSPPTWMSSRITTWPNPDQ